MDINLNGARCSLPEGSLVDLLAAQSIDPARRGVAIAVNETIVPKSRWQATRLKDGDIVEIVRPHSGG